MIGTNQSKKWTSKCWHLCISTIIGIYNRKVNRSILMSLNTTSTWAAIILKIVRWGWAVLWTWAWITIYHELKAPCLFSRQVKNWINQGLTWDRQRLVSFFCLLTSSSLTPSSSFRPSALRSFEAWHLTLGCALSLSLSYFLFLLSHSHSLLVLTHSLSLLHYVSSSISPFYILASFSLFLFHSLTLSLSLPYFLSLYFILFVLFFSLILYVSLSLSY